MAFAGLVADRATAQRSALERVPMITSTLSSLISFFAFWTAVGGSDAVSSTSRVILEPFTPPRLFTSSTAIWALFFIAGARMAKIPVTGIRAPILMVRPAVELGWLLAQDSRNAAAAGRLSPSAVARVMNSRRDM